MSASVVLAFAGVAALLTITPGVDMALVARSAITDGRGAALATTFGVTSGLLTWALASALGVAALLAASATAYDVLRAAGAAYLIWLGVRALMRAGEQDAAAWRGRRRSPYVTGLVSNLTNPKIVVFYSTVLPTFIPHGASVFTWSLVLASIHALQGLAWLSAYAWAVTRARSFVDRPRVRRALDRLSGTVLVGLGVRLAVER